MRAFGWKVWPHFTSELFPFWKHKSSENCHQGYFFFRNNYILLLEQALLGCCKIDRMNLFHWISPFLYVNEGFGWKVWPHFTSELFPLRPRELSKLRSYVQCECNKISVPSENTAHLSAGPPCLFCHMKLILMCHLIPRGCAECIF